MTPKIVDKEAKKLEIIEAAIKVFSEKGMVKAKMADIAETAGIGKGTIYEYFRSKEDVFAAGFKIFFQDMENEIAAALQANDNPVGQLRILVRLSFTGFLQQGADMAAIMMDFWAEGIRNKDEKILSVIDLKKIYDDYRTMIQSILSNGIQKGIFRKVDTLHVASLLIGSLDGVMLQWIMDRNAIDLEKMTDSVIDTVLNGIYKK